MRLLTRLGLRLALIAAAGWALPALASDDRPAADDAAATGGMPGPPVTRLICTPKALGLVCSTTNLRAAVTAGQAGRSQTLTAAPYQPYAVPHGRVLTGFDVDLTVYANRSEGGRVFLMVDIGGDAHLFDLTDQIQPGKGGIRTVRFSTDRALMAEGMAADGGSRLPIHLLLTAQTRAAADTARLDVIEIEMRPRSGS
ncbi:hypothetical protein FHP25_38015 [Vineibacter terrae]|uniref:Uncharacterized protein n=1 Tax=Vineibacter terrae TaxID=2586908 RepID=A0A5C8P7P0_9HYPH|nr:hypothetical protein [Vineibacter terrae]TXL69663.1 hypothetical protein FHP25_38015 [Vineibacter terrae]